MSELELVDDIVADTSAGARAIRGSALRGTTHVLGLLLLLIAFPFLSRYLGVVDFGRYVTVMTLVTVVVVLTDSGLTTLGQRELVQADSSTHAHMLGNVLGIRLALTPLAVLAAIAFGWAVGYDRDMILGLAIAGAGATLLALKATAGISLETRLRFGPTAGANLVSDVIVVAGIVLLVVAGAPLVPFFSIHLVAAAGASLYLLVRVGPAVFPRPRFVRREWGPLLRQALPMGIATAISTLYYRLLLVICSVIATGYQTGLFATSFRIIEFVIAACVVLITPFFPILAHAGKHDEERLRYALQRMLEAALLLACGLVLAIAIGGPTIVRLLAGEEYREAGPVLQIQSFALIGWLTAYVWYAGLVAVRRQRDLVLRSTVGLVVILAIGAALIPAFGAKGAAVGAVVGELAISATGLVLLLRVRPGLRLQLGFVPRVALAAGLGAACLLVPGIPELATAALAVAVYAGAALVLRAVPRELLDAFRS